jgi:hypothetical protein
MKLILHIYTKNIYFYKMKNLRISIASLGVLFSIYFIFLNKIHKNDIFSSIKFLKNKTNSNNLVNLKTSRSVTEKKKPSLINLELKYYLDFILCPTNLCQIEQNKKIIFVYVFVSIKNFSKRNLIRKTWANKLLFSLLRVAFIIGKSNDKNLQKEINNEQLIYNDLIQGNFIDAYRNLSFKSLIAWKWINKYCSNSKFIIKIDDDVVLNSYTLNKFMHNEKYLFYKFDTSNLKNSFICHYWKNAAVIRDPKSKYYVTKDEYNKNTYPTYCAGMAIIMTPDLIKKLFEESYNIKIFWIDDVYVGILGRFIGAKFFNGGYLQTDNHKYFNSYFKHVLFINNCDSIHDYFVAWNYIKTRV